MGGVKGRREEEERDRGTLCKIVLTTHRMEEKKVRRSERWRLAGMQRTHTSLLE